ncbi:TPA: TetR/AcrR family transcriptional regulator, partial [Streptococcus agalactiae]
ASTNEIVKRANISKGSLFNYFNSKKDLYLYLIEYSSKAIVNLNEEIDLSETDLFKRIERVALQKFYVQQKYPQAFEFLASTKQEESVEVKDIIKQRLNPIYNQAINKLYKDIDYSKFREGVDIEKAIEILNWTMFGVGEKGLKELFTFDDIGRFGEKYLEEWNVYAELLKYSFYK